MVLTPQVGLTVSDDKFDCRNYFVIGDLSTSYTKIADADVKRTFLSITAASAPFGSYVHPKFYVGGQNGILINTSLGYPNSPHDLRYKLKWEDAFSATGGEVACSGDGVLGYYAAVVECACRCGNDPGLECRCDLSYDYRQYSATIALNDNTLHMLVPSNSRRVSLVISCSDTTPTSIVLFHVGNTSNPTSTILSISAPFSITMPYRDWGPIIRQEIWIEGLNLLPAKTVYATEIVEIPLG